MAMTLATRYACCDDRRRIEVDASAFNGIDFLEVLDPGVAAPEEDRQRTLFVHFVKDPTPLGAIGPDNVVIEGGDRIRDVRAVQAQVAVDPRSGSTEPILVVEVDNPGDHSTYTLRLVPTAAQPLDTVDVVLRSVAFSFKVNCPTTFDPATPVPCPVESRPEPVVDYLARDYASLRQALLDRLAVLAPTWAERNPADLGVTLVELLAYVGDQLSYRQDAVGTEAYLGTCRLRTSARRHARLVDYVMHDGCNARTWVQVRLADGTPAVPLDEAAFYSAVVGLPTAITPGSRDAARVRAAGVAFRLLRPARLDPAHNLVRFHTWGARRCWLPRGATRATLRGPLAGLAAGDVLVLAEVRDPQTGDPAGADPTRRHPVLLTEVTHAVDPLGGRFDPVPTDDPVPVAEVTWAAEDALPFPLCVSTEVDDEAGGAFVEDVSVALGNVVLADHGELVTGEALPEVPRPRVLQARKPGGGDPCAPDDDVLAPVRYRPVLARGPLTQAVPFDPARPLGSAHAATAVDPRAAVALVELDDGTTQPWRPRPDLLRSGAGDRHVVVEVEADGRGHLRFGDGTHGLPPEPGRSFTATYRVGNGPAGNVGTGTLAHVVTALDGIEGVDNLTPGVGGVDLETVDEVRANAPFAFRPRVLPVESATGGPSAPGVAGAGPGDRAARPDGASLRRAVTPADYAAVLEVGDDVQRASASIRWTGSWSTVSIMVDLAGGGPLTPADEARLRARLEPFRLAGHDIEIEAPRFVALEVEVRAQAAPGYAAGDVQAALLAAFSSRALPGGRTGLFHPDNLTFGQTVHLSPIYAVAQATEGVRSVVVPVFQRQDQPGRAALDEGRIVLARTEVARLDNDPNAPDRGVLTVIVESGDEPNC